jgi:hypothetical protein
VTDVAVRPAEHLPEPVDESGRIPGRADQVFRAALVIIVAAAVIVRFSARQPLWLDEAQSVAIAKLPWSGSGTTMFTGLREDGSPPLYYLILHVWIGMFGSGNSAVRALSALTNLAAAVPIYHLGKRLVGTRAAQVSVVLYLTSPFTLYFATETRMYSLIVLLTALGALALEQTLRAPSPRSVVALSLCAGGLALTHYWCFYLLLTVVAWLVLLHWRPAFLFARGDRASAPRPGVPGDGTAAATTRPRFPAAGRRGVRCALGGIAGGALVFSPWLRIFAYQKAHTGTPWGEPASFAAVSHAYGQWAGGATTLGRLLLLFITMLVALGIAGRGLGGRFVLFDLKGSEPARTLFFLSTGTLFVAVTAGQVVGNAWADRYTATAFVPFVLVVGLGATVISSRRLFQCTVVLLAAVGVLAGTSDVLRARTQAGEAAAVLQRLARPGDVMLVCPDQLGPGLARTVPSWLKVYVVPTYAPPDRVVWVDYEKRNTTANGVAIAERALAEAGPEHTVFLAGSGSYRTYEDLCTQVRSTLQEKRPHADEVMKQGLPAKVYENYAVLRFLPS